MISLPRACHRPIAAAAAAVAVASLGLLAPVPAASAAAMHGLGPPNTWVPTGSMRFAHSGQTATLLPGGLSSTEDWSRGNWTRDTSMIQPTAHATATELPDGTVLVAGGDSRGIGGRLSTAELFMPVLVSMHPNRGPAGTQVTVSGSGFYAHETVRVLWGDLTVIGHPVTTASGTFTATVTIPAAKPGRHQIFAVGNRSANTLKEAQATFTVTG